MWWKVSTNRCRSSRGADQRRPKGRLVGQLAHCGAFLGAHPLDLLIDVDVFGVQLDIPPRRDWISRDDLHRLVELYVETGRQVRMPLDHRVHRIAQPMGVKGTAQRDVQLHRIHIVVVALRGAGVEE